MNLSLVIDKLLDLDVFLLYIATIVSLMIVVILSKMYNIKELKDIIHRNNELEKNKVSVEKSKTSTIKVKGLDTMNTQDYKNIVSQKVVPTLNTVESTTSQLDKQFASLRSEIQEVEVQTPTTSGESTTGGFHQVMKVGLDVETEKVTLEDTQDYVKEVKNPLLNPIQQQLQKVLDKELTQTETFYENKDFTHIENATVIEYSGVFLGKEEKITPKEVILPKELGDNDYEDIELVIEDSYVVNTVDETPTEMVNLTQINSNGLSNVSETRVVDLEENKTEIENIGGVV